MNDTVTELYSSQQRAKQLAAAFVHAPFAVSVNGGPDLVFQLANSRYLEMVGRTDVIGKPFRLVFPELPEDAPLFAMVKRVYETGEPFTAEEYGIRLARRGGVGEREDVYFKFTCQPLRDDHGDVTALMTVAVDVTPQVEARQRVEGLIGELRLADQRKDEFLATLAHELRNPMAAISTALSLLDRGANATSARRYRDTARRQMANLVRLVDDLLDVARITRGNVELRKERIDPAAVLKNALAATRPVVEARGHELAVSLGPGALRVDADPTRLEQVIVNLLTNAAKYTEPGGKITVALSREESQGESQVVLRVRDTGRGIPKDMLDKVFDLFTQIAPPIDRSTGGLGLGLTLVKRLVEMHGGKVEVSSSGPGKGSEFVVRLPLARSLPNQRSTPVPSAAAESPSLDSLGIKPESETSGTLHILLVEDMDDVRETLRDFLMSLGHEVAEATTGTEGLERLLELRPEVALIDVGLPGIDGFEVARRARAAPAGERLYLVALTGYGGPEVKVTAVEAGFDLHLVKPIGIDELEEILNQRVANRATAQSTS